ncbi:ATP-binding protein, partial [Coprococcus comes]|uniref:ATP-binding protein n=1 Tax=Coprococcus comes TaxID=410072 RepID=UPI001FBB9E36
MNRELQNMSEESLQNLEEIVETELLTVEDIRERMDTTEKGKIRQSIQNCKYALEHDPCLKGAICRNEMTCQIDIMKKMPWKRRGVHMTDTDMNNLALYLEKNYGLTSDRVITKATGSGKTYMACAFGMEACKHYYSVRYVRLPDLLLDLQAARDNGTFSNVLKKYTKPIVLILDEWLLLKLTEAEARNLFEMIHKRRKKSSTIFCSQFRESEWYQQICDG